MTDTLTPRERQIVTLVAAGYVRWRIAEVLDVSEDQVRDTIRQLCARYDCRMDKLPDAVREAKD